MVTEIQDMVMSESKRMFNPKKHHGGKLDIDGKLNSRDFDIEIKNPNGLVNVEMNNYVNVSLPPKVGRTRSTNTTAQIFKHKQFSQKK